MLGQSQGTQWPGLSIEGGRLLEEVGAGEQTGGLMDIDLFPLLLVPLSWQDGSGPHQRANPFSVGCHPLRRKGFREVAWGS